MAKKFFRVEREFTKTVNRQMVVGHPKHRDPRGRVLTLDESAEVDGLIDAGRIKEISEKEYRKELGGERQDAGEARVSKAATGTQKLSATASDLQVRHVADELQVDVSKAKNRNERIKLVNAQIDKNASEEVSGDDTESRASRVATLTENSTLQPPAPAVLGAEPIVAAEDAAPTGEGEGGEGKGDAGDGKTA